jgi:hypothetical protein
VQEDEVLVIVHSTGPPLPPVLVVPPERVTQ